MNDNIVEIRADDQDELVVTLNKMANVYREHTSYNVVVGNRYMDFEVYSNTLFYIAEQRSCRKFLLFRGTEEKIVFDIWKGISGRGSDKSVSCEVYDSRIHCIAREYISAYAAKFGAKVNMRLNFAPVES